MKRVTGAFVVLITAVYAKADYQFDFDAALLPAGHGAPSCTAMIGWTPAPYGASVTGPVWRNGPEGLTLLYNALWEMDDQIPNVQPIESVTLEFDCAGQTVAYTRTFIPFGEWYLPGPSVPPPFLYEFAIPAADDCIPDIPLETNELPVALSLADACPNPFNPSTTISYILPRTEQVHLSVFDLNGKQVACLAAGLRDRGRHAVTFDASALASGVYMYTLVAGKSVITKKLVLLK
jgi:hypothetical protein